MNKNRWEIFQALVNEKPNSLTELANLLHQDYLLVKKETETLLRWELSNYASKSNLLLFMKGLFLI